MLLSRKCLFTKLTHDGRHEVLAELYVVFHDFGSRSVNHSVGEVGFTTLTKFFMLAGYCF